MIDTVRLFNEGDRVSRYVDLKRTQLRTGTVQAVHSIIIGSTNETYYQYDVLWDGDRQLEGGYFGSGLEKV